MVCQGSSPLQQGQNRLGAFIAASAKIAHNSSETPVRHEEVVSDDSLTSNDS
jgi:hypothetical protein